MSQQFRKNIPPEFYGRHFSLINFKTTFGNCVYKALLNRKWKEVDIQSSNFTLQWCQKERVNDVFVNGLNSNQRVNHFRLYTQLCRKDMLMKNVKKHKRFLEKQKKLVQKDWNFLPLTFFLPSEYIMFSQQFKRQGGIWIMKPTARCQGSGIFLVDKLQQVAPYRFKKPINQQTQPVKVAPNNTKRQQKLKSQKMTAKSKSQQQKAQSESSEEQLKEEAKDNQNWIIQQYIAKPLLFGKKKFDLRIYALCTNYSQLTVWLYRQGFARFTHEPYDTDNILNLESHLTNVQIQKHSENYDQIRGGKWLINKFKHYLTSIYNPKTADQCFFQIQKIIIHSLEAVQKHILVSKNSFQLYGYDIMIDSTLKPWLIEVNGGPSMTANTQFDCKLKCDLIDDVLTIVNLEGIVTGDEMTIGGFDLIVNKGIHVTQYSYSDTQTNLGWKNDRKSNYKHLLKQFFLRKNKQKVINQPKVSIIKGQQQKQNVKQISMEQIIRKQSKPLPKFYYKQKPDEQVDDCIRSFLKKQLFHLNKNNQDLQIIPEKSQNCLLSPEQQFRIYFKKNQINYHRFVPLIANKFTT